MAHQRNWSLLMSGVLAALLGGGISEVLSTTVHAASLGGNVAGYDNGVAGSIDDDTFVDRTGTTRTIMAIYGDGGFDTVAYFALNGNSIPNLPLTFTYIEADGTRFYRADATYNGSDGGYSSWTWGNGIFVGGAGDHDIEVWG